MKKGAISPSITMINDSAREQQSIDDKLHGYAKQNGKAALTLSKSAAGRNDLRRAYRRHLVGELELAECQMRS